MQKSLIFNSSFTHNFIEIPNKGSADSEFRVYFPDQKNLFYIEGISIHDYGSFDSGFKVYVKSGKSKHIRISPNCIDRDLDVKIRCVVESLDRSFSETYSLLLRTSRYNYTNRSDDQPDNELGSHLYKTPSDTCQLISTDPSITGNVKVIYSKEKGLHTEFIGSYGDGYNDRIQNPDTYGDAVSNALSNSQGNGELLYKKQEVIDYGSGARLYKGKYFNECYRFFAPLYIKDRMPSLFVIFKKKFDNTPENTFKDLVIVDVVNLSNKTPIGRLLNKSKNSVNFTKEHLYMDVSSGVVVSETTGIDISTGVISTKSENLTTYLTDQELPVTSFENIITDSYRRNGLLSHRILNLEFMFDDNTLETGDISNYIGMYCDPLDIIDIILSESDYSKREFYDMVVSGHIPSEYIFHGISWDWLDIFNDGKHVSYIYSENSSYNTILNYTSGDVDGKVKISADNLSYMPLVKKVDNRKYDISPSPYSGLHYIEVSFQDLYNKPFRLNTASGVLEILFDSGIEESIIKPIEHSVDDTMYYELIESKKISIKGIYDIVYGDVLVFFPEVGGGLTASVMDVYYEGGSTIISIESDDFTVESYPYVSVNISERLPIIIDNSGLPSQTVARISESINQTQYLISEIFTKNGNDFLRLYSSKGEISLTYNDGYNEDIHSSYGGLGSVSVSEDLEGDLRYIGDGTIENMDMLGDGIIQPTSDISGLNDLDIFMIPEFKIGMFSFYQIRALDFSTIDTASDRHLLEDMRSAYDSPAQEDSLIPGTFYTIDNLSESERITISIVYKKSGMGDGIEMERITVAPGSSKTFSTFTSMYGFDKIDETGFFTYRTIEGGSSYRIKRRFLFEDGISDSFEPTYTYDSMLSLQSQRFSEKLKISSDPSFIRTGRLSSEYSSLMELTEMSDGSIERSLLNKPLKWESSEITNFRNEPQRLGFSRVFGKTGGLSHFSDGFPNQQARSHEWFLLTRNPTGHGVFSESTKIYGFDSIDRAHLLDITKDRFSMYFESGWPNIKRSGVPIASHRTSNYSIIKKTGEREYETFYKGVRYRFFSDASLDGYKHSVVLNTRPAKDPATSPFQTHCVDDSVSDRCNILGVFPKLREVTDFLIEGDKNLDVNISLVQPGVNVYLSDSDVLLSEDLNSMILIQPEQLKQIVRDSFKSWTDLISDINPFDNNIEFTTTVTDEIDPIDVIHTHINSAVKQTSGIGDIRIVLAEMDNTDDVARTVYISESDFKNNIEHHTPVIILNSKKIFRPDGYLSNTGAYSLRYTLVHEIGHILGLGHTHMDDSVMIPEIRNQDKFSELYPNGLESGADGGCLYEIYFRSLGFNQTDVINGCSDETSIKDDDWEYIINHRFKTVTLRIDMFLDGYMTQDSIKSYTDIYLSGTLYRTSLDNMGKPYLEGSDIRIPPADLSVSGFKDFPTFTTVNYIDRGFDILTEDVLGSTPRESYYRLYGSHRCEIEKGYLDYDPSTYRITTINNSPISRLDGFDYINIPFGSTSGFGYSEMWRIGGGSMLANHIEKLSLDGLSRVIDDIKQTSIDTDGNIESDRLFRVGVVPPKRIKIENSLVITSSSDGLKRKTVDVSHNIYRHSGFFSPKTTPVTFFGVSEDSTIQRLIGSSLRGLNTRFLIESPDFGKSVITMPIYSTDMIDINGYSEYRYDTRLTYLGNRFYRIYRPDGSFIESSGFIDPSFMAFPLGTPLPSGIIKSGLSFNIQSDEFTQNNGNIIIDLYKILHSYFKEIYREVYYRIYTGVEEGFENSLDKFISGSLDDVYGFSGVNVYTSAGVVLRDVSYSESLDGKLSISLPSPMDSVESLDLIFNL